MKTKKAKYFMEAVIVTAITLAFIMPSTAVLTNEQSTMIPEGTVLQSIIDTKQDALLKQNPQPLAAGDDIWLTPFYGDDYMPALTVDGLGNVVVVWTNEETFTTSYQGIIHTNNPEDEMAWQENAVIFSWSMENPVAWDIAFIDGDHFTGLTGCAYDYAELAQIGFQIDDITDLENTLQAWTWSGENPGFISCESIDQPTYAGNHYPDLFGYSEAMIYHFEGMGYDLPGCPVLFRTDPVGMSGLSYFDAQENEDTQPANGYDFYVKDTETLHHAMSNDETGKVIWKMTKQWEEADIEYTPYQATIGDGGYVQMAGNPTTLVITAIDGGSVKAFYSSDDGSTWQTSTIGSGSYANVCEVNGVFYCVFTNNGNLYLSSSDNGGASWSNPSQVNDVDGTVVEGHKYFDVHKGGIVWTDERGEDWDVYYQSLSTGPSPILTIEGIGGGFGVSASVNNIGTADATNVQWTISSVGSVFVGAESAGTISSIAPEGSAGISSFLIGFGDVEITIEVTCDEGAGAKETVSGKLLLFFLQM